MVGNIKGFKSRLKEIYWKMNFWKKKAGSCWDFVGRMYITSQRSISKLQRSSLKIDDLFPVSSAIEQPAVNR